MKLILIDGGPASGKNTLGDLLVQKFQKQGNRAKLLDLDTYVEKYNPNWIWKNNEEKEKDQLKARKDFAKDIDKHIQQGIMVIAIGERFLTKENIINFISRLKTNCPVYLYHLNSPVELRKQRLQQRGLNSLIDINKDQENRNSNKKWYGHVYKNINSVAIDAQNLYKLFQDNQGFLNIELLKK